MISMKVHGTAETKRALERMSVKIQKRVAMKALRPAATEVTKAFKKATPQIDDALAWELTGVGGLDGDNMHASLTQILQKNKNMSRAMQRLIKMSIGRKAKGYRNTGTQMIAVGPRYDYREPGMPLSGGYVAQLLEFGDDTRPAHPFLRRALGGVAQKAANTISSKVSDLVREEARAAGRASRG